MLIAKEIFYVTVLLLIYFCDQFVAPEIVKTDVTAVFAKNQHSIQRQGQDFDKKFVFEGEHSRDIDRSISWEKLDKCGVNKLLIKLQGKLTGSHAGSGRPRSANHILSYVGGTCA